MDVYGSCQLYDLVYWKRSSIKTDLSRFGQDTFRSFCNLFCRRCIVSNLQPWIQLECVFRYNHRYVNFSCQGFAFCDPTFRYGNHVKFTFEETGKVLAH